MTAPLLDLDALVAPIPGNDPRGQRFTPDKLRELADARKDTEPNPDNPYGPPIPKRLDWQKQIKTTAQWLTTSCKDLRIAVHLVEAVARQHGFAGLREGLVLLQRLFSECGDRMYPVVEDDGDLETRAGMVLWLNDPAGGALFPNTLRALPLFFLRDKKLTVSNRDWAAKKVGDTPIDIESPGKIEFIKPDTPREIADCLTELGNLEQVLSDKLKQHAPVLLNVRQALEDCQRLLSSVGPAALTDSAAMDSAAAAPASTNPASQSQLGGGGLASSVESRARSTASSRCWRKSWRSWSRTARYRICCCGQWSWAKCRFASSFRRWSASRARWRRFGGISASRIKTPVDVQAGEHEP